MAALSPSGIVRMESFQCNQPQGRLRYSERRMRWKSSRLRRISRSESFWAVSRTKPVQLLVNGTAPAGLQDSLGRYLNGGANVTSILSKRSVTITNAAVEQAAARQRGIVFET